MITEPLAFGGETIRVELEVYWDELDRRHLAPSIYSAEMLDLMFRLPEGRRVRLEDVPLWGHVLLAEAPGWAVQCDGDFVIRRYRPSATVQTVLAANADDPWTVQLAALRWFTPLGRAVVLVADIRDGFDAIDGCSPHGLGVGLLQPDGSWQTLVEPSIGAVQMTSARWHLAELAVQYVRPSV